MMKLLFCLLLLPVFTMAEAEQTLPAPTMPPVVVRPLPKPDDILFLSPTIYYKPVLSADPAQCAGTPMVELKDIEDKVLTVLCPKDHANCLMQGACYVADEWGRLRSFNYVRRGVDQLPRWGEVNTSKCPYGYGVRNVCLDPHYSVAADLDFHKLGDVIFVPRLVGVAMPDGSTHHGYLVIRDKGAAIKGPHRFDFFTGFVEPYVSANIMRKLGFSESKNSFVYRKATAEEAEMVRRYTAYPGLIPVPTPRPEL
ncbi:murein transglycosylase [Bdellovibrio bacteriovorus]|uniref:Murein transglycosylase n=1 Tax=Bdellovibrio bacteriovorus TaxID=959 RepID=A0A150WH57_BDEBC|nr:3D domain-containing protein [Bdellovibrio bacteriovorus]KYG62431.1 murein transglycosylase [Bdellovibrio bacteriovorus]